MTEDSVPSEADAGTDGDPHLGFSDFYEQAIARVLFRACLITRDPDLARDVAQDAMVVMLECWPQRRANTVKDNVNYASGVAANLAQDTWRRFAAQARVVARLAAATRHSPPRPVDVHVSLMTEVSVALDCLTRQQRAVAVLSMFDMTTSDIAYFLRIDASTVRSLKQKIRKRLSQHAAGSAALPTIEKGP